MKKNHSPQKQRGFTLVELSIVLVIIGLIIAGILGGEQLIKGAKAGRAVSDASKYMAAFNAFKIKYGDVPGDMPNAWDTFTTIPVALQVNSCASPDPCLYPSKAGDGHVMPGPESASTFVQLSMAGILPTGAYNPPSEDMPEAANARCNVNMPKGPYPGSCWQLLHLFAASVPLGGGANQIVTANSNWLQLSAETEVIEVLDQESHFLGGAAMTVDDALAIDLKADDGKPGSGNFIAGSKNIFGPFSEPPYCVDFSAVPGCGGFECLRYPDEAATYNVGERTPVCLAAFKYH